MCKIKLSPVSLAQFEVICVLSFTEKFLHRCWYGKESNSYQNQPTEFSPNILKPLSKLLCLLVFLIKLMFCQNKWIELYIVITVGNITLEHMYSLISALFIVV